MNALDNIARQLIICILVAILLGILGFIVLGPLANLLASSPQLGNLSAPQRIQAVNNARNSLLQFGAGIVAVGALIYNARNHTVARKTYELSERGQVTDRYAKAIEELSGEAIETRLGGIYILERIARDSPSDQQTVIDVLCAYVRNYSRPEAPSPVDEDEISAPADLQAAMLVLGRRDSSRDQRRLDLRNSDLRGVEIQDGDLSGCYMLGADFSHSSLHRMNLSNANLAYIDFHEAHLVDVNFSGSQITRSKLDNSYINHADFQYSNLSDYTSFSGASIDHTSFSGAYLEDANFTGCKFTDIDFSSVDLDVTNLSGANLFQTEGLSPRKLSSSLINEETNLPDEIEWDPHTRKVIWRRVE